MIVPNSCLGVCRVCQFSGVRQVTKPDETANQSRCRVWKEAADRWKNEPSLRQASLSLLDVLLRQLLIDCKALWSQLLQ